MTLDTKPFDRDCKSPSMVHVSVRSEYLPHQSEPDVNRYAFAYHIRIENLGDQAAKLLRRHWVITDAEQKSMEVKGDGVLGEQPTIEPGDEYHYTSGTVLETPIGFMQGRYEMVGHDGQVFSTQIPAFTLAIPNSLH